MNIEDAIQELRKVSQAVPKPLRLPTVIELEAAERRLGFRFHADYRVFQLEASNLNYGTIEPAVLTAPGSHTDLLQVAENAWRAWGVPRQLLPFCEANSNYYCIGGRGQVSYWPHDGTSSEKWRSLGDWIVSVWIGTQ